MAWETYDDIPDFDEGRNHQKKERPDLKKILLIGAFVCLIVLIAVVLWTCSSGFSNTYIYNIVYRSSTGTELGTATAEFPHGSTNTITPPSFDGYTTPAAQTVVWNADDGKTITFIYDPTAVSCNILCRSSNGTELGTVSEEYLFGTTNVIAPPNFADYISPDPQTVVFDSLGARTITFIYEPISVSNQKSGYIYNDTKFKLGYSVDIEYQNRTETSIQLRVVWTAYLSGSQVYNAYGQRFIASVGSVDTGAVIVTNYGEWRAEQSETRSATAYSPWITVPLNTAHATTVDMDIYYYQVGKSGKDVTENLNVSGLRTTWTVNIPAY